MPNVAVQSAKSWHHLTKITHIHILARLQRQGIRRSCWDPTKKTWHSKWCIRSSNDLQTSPKIPNDFQRMSLKCGGTKCQNLGTTLARSWYPFLVRLQRQGVRRSCWDPTCLGKITFLVNFQVNGYGTSEILLFACDWCFWSTGMWHRFNACEMAVYSTALD